MVKKNLLIIFTIPILTLLSSSVSAYNCEYPEDQISSNEDIMIAKKLDKFLLPEDHPIKSKLDEIFSYPDVLSSLETLRSAGFNPQKIRKKALLIVRHPEVEGYVFKVYLDTAVDMDEVENFTIRIKGARLVQKEIEKGNFQNVC